MPGQKVPHCKFCGHPFVVPDDNMRRTHAGSYIGKCPHCDVCSSGTEHFAPDKLSGEALMREILVTLRRVEVMLSETKPIQ